MSSLPCAKGELFRYSNSASACVAFEYDVSNPNQERSGAGAESPNQKVALVVVGGLTDGLFPVPYLSNLADLLREKNREAPSGLSLSLITPLLSSSHKGWGTGSLDRDASELLELAGHLSTRRGIDGVVLVGHSTGCQDAIRFAQRHRERRKEEKEETGDGDGGAAPPLLPRLSGVVLQAPVSDRECFFSNPETAPWARELLEKAEKALENQTEEQVIVGVMSSWDGAPLSATRWKSLTSRGGDDDMFSSDFTDEELEERVGRHLRGVPTLVVASEREQYLPKGYDTPSHARRLAAIVNGGTGSAATAEAISLDGDHALYGAEAEAAEAIVDFVFRRCLS